MLGQKPLGKVQMPLRYHIPQLGFQLFLGEFAFALAHIVLGNHHIHTIGFVADVLVDPVQLFAQLLRIHKTGAQHTQTTGLADFHHHVAAMG